MYNIEKLALKVIELTVEDYVYERRDHRGRIMDEDDLKKFANGPWLSLFDLDPDVFIAGCHRKRNEVKGVPA